MDRIDRIPQTISGLKQDPKSQIELGWPKKDDFTKDQLDVMFWHRKTWINFCNEKEVEKGARGPARAAEGINVQMLYVVNEEGEPIDGHRAKKMRDVARAFWNGLSNAGVAPWSWKTHADLSMMQKFKLEMQTQFPELRLCDGGWKVDQIAIDNYSGWRGGLREKGMFNKTNKENATIIASDEEDTSSAGRTGTSDKQTPGKRKTKGDQSKDVPAAKKQKKSVDKPAVVDKGKEKAKPVQLKNPLYVVSKSSIIYAENI